MMRRLYLAVRFLLDIFARFSNTKTNTQTEPYLRPGQKGEPLPGGIVVLRLGIPSKDAQLSPLANEEHFYLSSDDKKSDLKSLSVWAKDLTPAETARELMAEKRAEYRLVLYLNVDNIRAIRHPPASTEALLDVAWDPIPQPGAEGHSGITGLMREKDTRKALRLRLAELARPEFLPE